MRLQRQRRPMRRVSYRDLESIEGDSHPIGKPRFKLLMLQIVAQVGEPRLQWLHFTDYRESFVHAHMRRVGFVPEGIHDEMIHAADLFNHRRWDCFAVAQVSSELLATPRKQISKSG